MCDGATSSRDRETLLVERANFLTLTAPEMTVLVGGMRALNANFRQSQHGVLTDKPETLTNDFFVHLLDMRTEWKASASAENVYEGRDRATGKVKWTAAAVDLVRLARLHTRHGRGGDLDLRAGTRIVAGAGLPLCPVEAQEPGQLHLVAPGDGFDDDPLERGEYLAHGGGRLPRPLGDGIYYFGLVHWRSPFRDGRTRRITGAAVVWALRTGP